MLLCNAHMMQGLFLRLFGMSEKIQGTYFKICALYFKIYGLYFSTFQVSDKQRLIKAFQKGVKG